MAGNSARYSPNSWWIDRLQIAIESWQISCKHLLPFLSYVKYLKSVFLNIYNCVWKPGFLKSSHIYSPVKKQSENPTTATSQETERILKLKQTFIHSNVIYNQNKVQSCDLSVPSLLVLPTDLPLPV